METEIMDMAAVQLCITDADEYGLTTEVVYSALKAMKENNNLSIEQAIQRGYGEWIK